MNTPSIENVKSLFLIFFVTALRMQAADLSDLTWEINDGDVTITDCNTNASGELIIPETVDGFPVVSIGSYAFLFCSGLISISLPESVTFIGRGAFHSCTNLTSIDIPESVTFIGRAPFNSCTNLTSINVAPSNPSFQSLDGVLFNKSIGTLISYPIGKPDPTYRLPFGVSSIGNGAFHRCYNLTSVFIPESVSSIGNGAFASCSNLTSVVIPPNVTSIESATFIFCSSLTSISLPNGIVSIGEQAFDTCYSLTTIVIPDSVISIEQDAFFGCSNLAAIYFDGGPPPSVSAHAFISPHPEYPYNMYA